MTQNLFASTLSNEGVAAIDAVLDILEAKLAPLPELSGEKILSLNKLDGRSEPFCRSEKRGPRRHDEQQPAKLEVAAPQPGGGWECWRSSSNRKGSMTVPGWRCREQRYSGKNGNGCSHRPLSANHDQRAARWALRRLTTLLSAGL